jgi:mannosyltransferase
MRDHALFAWGRRAERILLAGAVVLAAALRFAALDARGWWRDEAVTVRLLRLPFDELLRTIPDSEGTPPLYYVLAWGWTRLFGDSEAGLRSFSALVGTVTVVVVYLAGRELVSKRTGIVAAYFTAASPLLVWHAQDARAYSLLVLLGGLSFLFFVRLVRTPAPPNALGFAIASALSLATHYFAVFLVVPEAVWLLAARRTRRLAVLPVVAIAVVGAALVPLVLAQRGNVRWISEVPRYRRLIELVQEFLVGPQAPWERPTTVLAGLLAAAALLLVPRRVDRQERIALRPAMVVGLAALALPLLLVLAGLDYVLGRNLIVAWIPLAIVAAAGLTARRAGPEGIVVAAALVALGIGTVIGSAESPKFGAEDWRGAARALGPPPVGGRAIVLWPDAGLEPFRLYRPDAVPLPDDGRAVSEVVVATFGQRRRDDDLLRALAPPEGLFRESARRDEPYFTLVRYTADHPVVATVDVLVPSAPGAPRGAVLAER